MRRILPPPPDCYCKDCGWQGDGMDLNEDSDGDLICPECGSENIGYNKSKTSISKQRLDKEFKMKRKALMQKSLESRKTQGNLFRTMKVDKNTIDKAKRTVEFALSSEFPVNRGWYTEVLSHDPKDVDLSRLNNSHPMLVNHNPDDQVGVIESARIDNDHVLRFKGRFGNSVRATEIFNDVCDGIRQLTSVGYEHKDEVDTQRDAKGWETVRFSWMPYEASIVAIPADPTVGQGRSKEKRGQRIFGSNAVAGVQGSEYCCPNCSQWGDIDSWEEADKGDDMLRCPNCGEQINGSEVAANTLDEEEKLTTSPYQAMSKELKLSRLMKAVRALVNGKLVRLKSKHVCTAKCRLKHATDEAIIENLEEQIGYDIDGDNEQGESSNHVCKVCHCNASDCTCEHGVTLDKKPNSSNHGKKVVNRNAGETDMVECYGCGHMDESSEFEDGVCPNCQDEDSILKYIDGTPFNPENKNEGNHGKTPNNKRDAKCASCGCYGKLMAHGGKQICEKCLRDDDGVMSKPITNCPACGHSSEVCDRVKQDNRECCPECMTPFPLPEVKNKVDGKLRCPDCDTEHLEYDRECPYCGRALGVTTAQS